MAMLDNDNLTYKKRLVGNADARLAERTLITLERSQKLDLMIHLLANLRQALIVCGPEGIGKTTLLQMLQDRRKDQWQICLLQGSSALSFESIVSNLIRFLNIGGQGVGFDLSSLRTYCEKQKVVLIIDDAGDLVPGLIGELVDFADSLSGLRLVFSMTYDEFHIKSASDKAIDDCHFIELPPLNLKQCTEYLQNLSAQPGAMLSFNAVTDSLVEELYRETHGIPGRILAEIPKLNEYQTRKKSRLGLWAGITVVVLAAGWTIMALLPSTPPSETKIEKVAESPEPSATQPPVADIKTVAPDLTAPAPAIMQEQYSAQTLQIEPARPGFLETPLPKPAQLQSPVAAKTPDTAAAVAPKPVAPQVSAPSPTIETPRPTVAPAAKTEAPAAVAQTETKASAPQVSAKAPDETLAGPKPAAPEASAIAPTVQAPQPSVTVAAPTEAPTTVTQTAETEAKQPRAPTATVTTTPEQKPAVPVNDLDWIKAQPANNYTIQIMMLSSKDSVNRFLKKHAAYRDNLKYFPIRQFDQERYVLIYGSFQTAGDALKRKATMPEEFKDGVERRFKSIQQQIRR